MRRDELVARLRAAGCVFAEDEATLLAGAAGSPTELAALVDRRVTGVPLEHVLGWVEFCGLRVEVDEGVFVPRRRTELLVRAALTHLAPGGVAVELCCGAAAVATVLLRRVAGLEVHVADVDPAALACARRNVEPLGGQVHLGDLDGPLPKTLHGRVDVLIANAPYVPTNEIALMPPEAREHEPHVALDGGTDGMDVLRRVIACAPRWLAPGGHVLVEANDRQAPALRTALAAHGLVGKIETDEDLGATAVVGRLARMG